LTENIGTFKVVTKAWVGKLLKVKINKLKLELLKLNRGKND